MASSVASPSRSSSSSPRKSSPGPSSATNTNAQRLKDVSKVLPPSSSCSYFPCFCEENIWLLCDHVRRNNPQEINNVYVVFVSNQKQVVPLWRQKAGKDEEKLVIWDYHVILIYKPDERCLVFDLDSDLPFPTYFHKYVTETFRTDAILNPEYHRFFRVVHAPTFMSTFSSDRRHMRKPDGSGWMKTPPPHPPIQATPTEGQEAGLKHNLDDFISTDPGKGVGEVLSLKEFVQRFYRH